MAAARTIVPYENCPRQAVGVVPAAVRPVAHALPVPGPLPGHGERRQRDLPGTQPSVVARVPGPLGIPACSLWLSALRTVGPRILLAGRQVSVRAGHPA